ncbi:MAG TPA: hypothetical protein VMU38_11145 [Candidatus Binatia bacterium]|nr:hypothetical protein [Candidatus Binatia bacterium]
MSLQLGAFVLERLFSVTSGFFELRNGLSRSLLGLFVLLGGCALLLIVERAKLFLDRLGLGHGS